jgi:UDP-glucose 4-epimerase
VASRSALVTGAAGFIGSHLCELLIKRGYTVTAIDNLAVGRITNLSEVYTHPKFRFMELDITDTKAIEDLTGDFRYVFHLAALADIVPSIEKPREYFKTNVEGTLNILTLSQKLSVQKIVYAASSSCYGIPDSVPTAETGSISPEYPYALTKYLAEQLVFHWAKVYRLPALSLRLFNVYGPRSRTSGTYGAVFGVFLAQKLVGQPMTIVGDGTQTRDFTYVTDVAEAFLTAAEHPVVDEVFNVGSGGTYSINYLVELLGGNAINIPKRPGEPDCTFADTRKIQATLGWNPQVSFEEGVELMISNIKDWESAPVWNPQTIEKETALWFKFLSHKSTS